MTDRSAILSLTLGAIIICFSGVWVKISHVAPTVSAFYRVCFGIFLLVVCIVRREVRFWGHKNTLLLLACGFFAIASQTADRSNR